MFALMPLPGPLSAGQHAGLLLTSGLGGSLGQQLLLTQL